MKARWIWMLILVLGFAISVGWGTISRADSPQEGSMPVSDPMSDPAYREYLEFFETVYAKMQQEYYFPVTPENFQKFLYVFRTKIYSQLKETGKSRDFIKWRSAAFLVEALRDPEDIFSAFFPPKAAEKYEHEVLGQRIDLGIEGRLEDRGFRITRLEPRADAFEKGLREQDLLVKVDETDIQTLTEEKINELLTPLENTTVALHYLDHADGLEKMIQVVSKEYFKQTVFMIPVDVPNVYCLQIQRFNRATAEDMTRFMQVILEQKDADLIIDLRGNPGGPPLAAREISAFFLPPKDEFAYFQRKNKPKANLDVPEIPPEYHYQGNIVILVNEKSGSASELFTGILQRRGRAVVMGTNTAGQVLLKSMFYFDDDSMVLLVTARGFHPDGTVFSFKGVSPDVREELSDDELIHFAGQYLAGKRQKTQGG